MQSLILVVLLGIVVQEVAGVTHSLKYFYTASSGIKNFPEFVTVGMVDDVPFTYYDSGIRKEIPKQNWIADKEGPEYWERQTQISIGSEQSFKANINIAKPRFNQTGGVHIFQNMYGCEWDEETGEAKGYDQYGYDGEDFLTLNLKTESWIASKQQAFVTKTKWDNNKAEIAFYKDYYTQQCPVWLKKYLDYGKKSLKKTDLPSVSFLQKTSSSPVSCHATGFYPNRAEMFWRKDGEEIHDGVVKGEILPNNDGTFQMTADIDVSSASSEDWAKYECVFQLSGENDLITKLEKPNIRKNDVNSSSVMIIPIVIAAVALAVVAVIGVIVYKKRNDKRPPSPVENAEVQQQMLPTA